MEEKDRRFFKTCNWVDSMLYGDAVKAKHLGYESMHFKINEESETYYVEGDLFEKFATGVQDKETDDFILWNTLLLYKAKYGEDYDVSRIERVNDYKR